MFTSYIMSWNDAVKYFLNYSRLSKPEISEEKLVLQAIRDVNLPKFIPEVSTYYIWDISVWFFFLCYAMA